MWTCCYLEAESASSPFHLRDTRNRAILTLTLNTTRICFVAARARICSTRRTPCSAAAASRARRCRSRRTPRTCSAVSRARRCRSRRSLCTARAAFGARTFPCLRSPCTGIGPVRANTPPTRRTRRIWTAAGRAGTRNTSSTGLAAPTRADTAASTRTSSSSSWVPSSRWCQPPHSPAGRASSAAGRLPREGPLRRRTLPRRVREVCAWRASPRRFRLLPCVARGGAVLVRITTRLRGDLRQLLPNLPK